MKMSTKIGREKRPGASATVLPIIFLELHVYLYFCRISILGGGFELVEYLTLQNEAKEFDEVAFSEKDLARVDHVASLNNTCQWSPKLTIQEKYTKKENQSCMNYRNVC